MQERKVSLSVMIDPQIVEEIENLARGLQVSVGEVVRRAVSAGLPTLDLEESK